MIYPQPKYKRGVWCATCFDKPRKEGVNYERYVVDGYEYHFCPECGDLQNVGRAPEAKTKARCATCADGPPYKEGVHHEKVVVDGREWHVCKECGKAVDAGPIKSMRFPHSRRYR